MAKPKPDFRWEEMDNLLGRSATPRPPDSFTVEEACREYNLTRDAAYRKLIRLWRAGKLHSEIVNLPNSRGAACPTRIFYLGKQT